MTVVLPAPFGPISAWRAPFAIDSETSFAATMPPKCLSRPRVSSTGGMVSGPRPPRRRARRVFSVGDFFVVERVVVADFVFGGAMEKVTFPSPLRG